MLFHKNSFATVMNSNRSAIKDNKGFTLIEAAIVLGIVALVIGGIWVGAASVQENFRVGKAEQQVLQIASQARKFFYGSRTASNLDTDAAINYKMVPADMVVGSGNSLSLVTPWDGTVTVAVDTSDEREFVITYNDIPAAACASISARMSVTGVDTGLTDISINGASAWSHGTDGSLPTPLNPIAAAQSCGTSTTSTSDVAWTFKIN